MMKRHGLSNGINRVAIGMGGGGEQSYADLILSTSPIAYWPMNETEGIAAVNYGSLGVAANGTYSGCVLGSVPSPVTGNLAPFFDGTNDYLNIASAALFGGFNGQLGSIAAWFKVYDAAVWVGAAQRIVHRLRADGSNYFLTYKNGENSLAASYVAGGTSVAGPNVTNSAVWLFHVMTFSLAADKVIYYWNGSPTETDTGLGIWAGSLTSAIIGTYSTAAPTTNPWYGYISHVAMWNKVLTAAQVAALYAAGNPT